MNIDEICGKFLRLPLVETVIEFGSSARGQAPGDVDLLVVMTDTSQRHAVIDLAESLSDDLGIPVSVTVFTADGLEERLRRIPSFGAHLRDEGRLHGPDSGTRGVQAVLDRVEVTPQAIESELEQLRGRLRRMTDETKVGSSYGTVLGRLFAIGRAAAIVRLMADGEVDYEWRSAFERLAIRRPEFAPSLETVAALRPYFEALDGRSDPVQSIGPDALAALQRDAVSAVAALTGLNGATA